MYTGKGQVRWNFSADNGTHMIAILNSDTAFLWSEEPFKVIRHGSPDTLVKYGSNNLFYTLEHGDCLRWNYDAGWFLIPAEVYKSPISERKFQK